MITVTGSVSNPDGTPLDGRLVLRPEAWKANGAVVSRRPVVAAITGGAVSVDIVAEAGAWWRFVVESQAGEEMLDRLVQLPDAPTIDLAELVDDC